MKNLYEYINDQMLIESFASDTIKDIFFGLDKNVRTRKMFTGRYPMWDKITDNDIIKLEKDEAIKRMRSRKDPGYLIWYGYDRAGNLYCPGITWGCDVILTKDGWIGGITSSQISRFADGAYEIKDALKFIRNDIQQSRRNTREGALALKDYSDIKDENMKRYKQLLAKIHDPGLDNVIKLYTDAMNIYKNIVDKYVAKFVSIMQEGNGSYYDLCKYWRNINIVINELADKMSMYAYNEKQAENNKYYNDIAMDYYKDVSKCAKLIENAVNKFEEDSK